MLSGGLGWPEGGWPEGVWRAVLGVKRFKEAHARWKAETRKGRRSKEEARPRADLEKLRRELGEKLKREATDDDLYSHLMYPQVFLEFDRHRREFSDLSPLPTPAYFYGLRRGEEVSVEIEEGKTLIIRLINVSEPDKDGRRTLTYELNGITRETPIADRSVAPKAKPRAKADLGDPLQVGAPLPGLIASVAVTVGHRVAKGDRLLMMEAMKMQTTVSAPVDGVVSALHANIGDTVESKDLLVTLRAS
jgi:pyruvate carboxylase